MFPLHETTRDGRALVIREATGEDAAALLAFNHLICTETDFLSFGPGEYELDAEQQRASLEHYRATENLLYLLAEVDGELAAILFVVSPARPRLHHAGEMGTAVKQAFWGQGLCTKLMDAMMLWAKPNRLITKINLRVRSDNTKAAALYLKYGFTVEGLLINDIRVNGVYHDTYAMGMVIEPGLGDS